VAMRPVGLRASAPSYRSGMFCSTMCQKPPLKYTVPGDTTLTRFFLLAYWRARATYRTY